MNDSNGTVVMRTKSQKKTPSKTVNRIQSWQNKNLKIRPTKHESIGAFEDLVQCGICLEKLSDSRMLPCQHTFCLSCLQSHLMAKSLMVQSQPPQVNQIQSVLSNKSTTIQCPVCLHKVNLDKGFDSLEALPKNLYIDSLLKLIEGNISPITPKAPDYRCNKCQTYSEEQEQCCPHCMKIFCSVCWQAHLSELTANLAILVKQVDEAKIRLDHKLENLENRCEQLSENIHEATLHKIEEIKRSEATALKEVDGILKEAKVSYDNLNGLIDEVKDKLVPSSPGKDNHRVHTFMNLHRETSKLLNQVGHFGEAHVIFDPDTFRLDQDTEGIYNDVEENETINGSRVANPFESLEAMAQYYRTRSFVPKLIWNKCPRPANVGIPPWDNHLLYIAATDTHTVLILNKDRTKLEGRLTSPDMLYPQGLAFSKTHQEIYVSDKWKHCIHVFAKTGEYLRAMLTKGNGDGRVRSPDGLAMGPKEELVICDTGNDRIIVINPLTGQHLSTIGIIGKKTTFNMPTGVAVSDDRIIVADTGNHRIKIFNMAGERLHEFGALGRGKGQFRAAGVVAVDPLGFILVGDGGNARIQVFKPDGTLVKVFGGLSHGNDGFGWVSGITVTKELDIITTDSSTKSLRIF